MHDGSTLRSNTIIATELADLVLELRSPADVCCVGEPEGERVQISLDGVRLVFVHRFRGVLHLHVEVGLSGVTRVAAAADDVALGHLLTG